MSRGSSSDRSSVCGDRRAVGGRQGRRLGRVGATCAGRSGTRVCARSRPPSRSGCSRASSGARAACRRTPARSPAAVGSSEPRAQDAAGDHGAGGRDGHRGQHDGGAQGLDRGTPGGDAGRRAAGRARCFAERSCACLDTGARLTGSTTGGMTRAGTRARQGHETITATLSDVARPVQTERPNWWTRALVTPPVTTSPHQLTLGHTGPRAGPDEPVRA